MDGVGVGAGEDINRVEGWNVAQVRGGVLAPFKGLLCGGVRRQSIVVWI
jgi:hypothetical protein